MNILGLLLGSDCCPRGTVQEYARLCSNAIVSRGYPWSTLGPDRLLTKGAPQVLKHHAPASSGFLGSRVLHGFICIVIATELRSCRQRCQTDTRMPCTQSLITTMAVMPSLRVDALLSSCLYLLVSGCGIVLGYGIPLTILFSLQAQYVPQVWEG